MTDWILGKPLSPSLAATSLGIGTKQPPPPLGVGVSTPLNLTIETDSSFPLGRDRRAFREWPRVRARSEVLERRRRDEEPTHTAEGVTEALRDRVEIRRAQWSAPCAGVKPREHRLDYGDRLGGRKGAVAGTVDEHLAQHGLFAGG